MVSKKEMLIFTPPILTNIFSNGFTPPTRWPLKKGVGSLFPGDRLSSFYRISPLALPMAARRLLVVGPCMVFLPLFGCFFLVQVHVGKYTMHGCYGVCPNRDSGIRRSPTSKKKSEGYKPWSRLWQRKVRRSHLSNDKKTWLVWLYRGLYDPII